VNVRPTPTQQPKIQVSRVKKTNKREICGEVEKMKKKNWNEMSFGVCKSTAEIAPHIKSFLSIIAGKKIQNNNNKITSFSFSVYNTHEFFYTFILFSSVLKFPFG
jgi:hypothetical protein